MKHDVHVPLWNLMSIVHCETWCPLPIMNHWMTYYILHSIMMMVFVVCHHMCVCERERKREREHQSSSWNLNYEPFQLLWCNSLTGNDVSEDDVGHSERSAPGSCPGRIPPGLLPRFRHLPSAPAIIQAPSSTWSLHLCCRLLLHYGGVFLPIQPWHRASPPWCCGLCYCRCDTRHPVWRVLRRDPLAPWCLSALSERGRVNIQLGCAHCDSDPGSLFVVPAGLLRVVIGGMYKYITYSARFRWSLKVFENLRKMIFKFSMP